MSENSTVRPRRNNYALHQAAGWESGTGGKLSGVILTLALSGMQTANEGVYVYGMELTFWGWSSNPAQPLNETGICSSTLAGTRVYIVPDATRYAHKKRTRSPPVRAA